MKDETLPLHESGVSGDWRRVGIRIGALDVHLDEFQQHVFQIQYVQLRQQVRLEGLRAEVTAAAAAASDALHATAWSA